MKLTFRDRYSFTVYTSPVEDGNNVYVLCIAEKHHFYRDFFCTVYVLRENAYSPTLLFLSVAIFKNDPHPLNFSWLWHLVHSGPV